MMVCRLVANFLAIAETLIPVVDLPLKPGLAH